VLSEERWSIHAPAIEYALSAKWHRNWLKIIGPHFFTNDYLESIESILDKSELKIDIFYDDLIFE
jgi:hypothetical protein